jgi:hypothetical protein
MPHRITPAAGPSRISARRPDKCLDKHAKICYNVLMTTDYDPDEAAFEAAAAAERAYAAFLDSPDPDYYADELRAGR